MGTEELPHGRALRLAQVELRVAKGPDGGRVFEVGERATVGTAPTCAVQLTDPAVSRLHCELSVTERGLRVVDTGSRNGTWVDGVRIHDAYAGDGSPIVVGETTLCVALGGDAIIVPLSDRERFGPLLGSSTEMRRIYTVLERVAPTESTVLVQGETGTGKELVARALHDASQRAEGPFVTVDCGAIADNLIESELFGHRRGSFSGALDDRKGLFEEADGGTVFLDEIGELPLSLQPKLLRVLEARQVRPLGGNAMRPVDVRVVAATHRSLAERVNRGMFRADLYYRLAVVEVKLPPLRTRRGDVLSLARHFFAQHGVAEDELPPELMGSLLSRSWPGNVRELRNYVERRVCYGLDLSVNQTTEPSAVLDPAAEALVPGHLPLKEAQKAWTETFERAYLTALLGRADHNISRAAELAGVNRRLLYRMMDRVGVQRRGGER